MADGSGAKPPAGNGSASEEKDKPKKNEPRPYGMYVRAQGQVTAENTADGERVYIEVPVPKGFEGSASFEVLVKVAGGKGTSPADALSKAAEAADGVPAGEYEIVADSGFAKKTVGVETKRSVVVT